MQDYAMANRKNVLERIREGWCTREEWTAYEWLRYELQKNAVRHRSSSSFFGSILLEVPTYYAMAVEKFMYDLNIPLLSKTPYTNVRTSQVFSVHLEYKTRDFGFVNIPL